jgi:hypothetical protein
MPAPASPNRDIKNTFAAYIISYNKTVHNQINSLDHFLVTRAQSANDARIDAKNRATI